MNIETLFIVFFLLISKTHHIKPSKNLGVLMEEEACPFFLLLFPLQVPPSPAHQNSLNQLIVLIIITLRG